MLRVNRAHNQFGHQKLGTPNTVVKKLRNLRVLFNVVFVHLSPQVILSLENYSTMQ